MHFFLAWGKAWRPFFSKAEFAVYEQLDYSAKFQTCEGKARLQYENGHYDQTKDRFLRKRGGAYTWAPQKTTAGNGEPRMVDTPTTPPGTQLLPHRPKGRKPPNRPPGEPCPTQDGVPAAGDVHLQARPPTAEASPLIAQARQATLPNQRERPSPGQPGPIG